MTTTDNQRTAFVEGLRALADALASDETLPLPYEGSHLTALSVFCDNREQVVAYARLIGKVDKHYQDSASYGFQLTGALRGLNLRVYADRNEVCTRRVVGTREVTKEIRDPEALKNVPLIEVTETVEDVVWDCAPLLAPQSAAQVPA